MKLNKIEANPRRLWRRYIMGLVAIAVAAGAVFVTSSVSGNLAEYHAVKINVSGRQRMLSQRIALFASEYARGENAEQKAVAAANLVEAVDLFEASHKALIYGDPNLGLNGQLTPKLRQLYFDDPHRLDEMATAFVSTARQLLAVRPRDAQAQLMLTKQLAAGELLAKLDLAVSAFEMDAQRAIRNSKRLEALGLVSALLVILFEGLFVFWPAHRSVTSTLDRLELEQNRLQEKTTDLLAANDTLKNIFANFPGAIAVYDADAKLTLCNENYVSYLDLDKEAFGPGVPYGKVVEHLAECGWYDTITDAEGNTLDYSKFSPDQILAKRLSDFDRDGSIIQGAKAITGEDLTIRVKRTPSGGIITTFTDVTKLKEAQRALQLTEARASHLALVAEHTGDAVVITEPLGKIQWVNAAFTRLTGYLLNETLGVRPSKVLGGPKTDLTVIEQLTQQAVRGQTFRGEIQYYTKEGKPIWFDLIASPVLTDNGEVSNFVTIMRDISDGKQMLEALANEKDRAAQANIAKSEFLANMSHELRTPMNGIIGMNQLLETTALDEKQQQYAETVQNSANHLMTIIEDLLDTAKIETGKLRLRCEVFRLSDVVSSVMQMMIPSAHEKSLQLRSEISIPARTDYIGDPGRVRQILMNLLGNAIKFTETGTVTLHLEQAERGFAIKIVDTGCGIAPEQLDHIFDHFEQGDSSTTRRYGGTGLGLGICRNIAEMMGGDISVESELGSGTTFTVNLPLTRVESENSPGQQENDADVDGNRRPLKVLVAEDHPVSQQIISTALENAHMGAVVVGNGQKALDALDRECFDLIIMDSRMPVMDGNEAISAIRSRDDRTRDIPILSLTANVLDSARHEALHAGANEYLTKPVDVGQLVRTVRKLGAEGQRSRDALAS